MSGLADRALGLPAFERLASSITRRRLRVLAYHGVPDRTRFRAQLEHLARHYNPVSGQQVVDAVVSSSTLPPRSVWITFDDGQRDVIEHGLPELQRLGMPATLFVCPGLVRAESPFWWTEVERALADGPVEFEGRRWMDRRLVTRLKQVDDPIRRDVVAQLVGALTDLAPGQADVQGTSVGVDGIGQWLEAGFEIGNHTWDHPCLDMCSPEEQHRQIADAHEQLVDLLGRHPQVFAYPNGDFTPSARRSLDQLGYRVALAFDHRLAQLDGDPLQVSRLRLDSDAPLDRARAILSGAHSGLFHLRSRFRGSGGAVS